MCNNIFYMENKQDSSSSSPSPSHKSLSRSSSSSSWSLDNKRKKEDNTQPTEHLHQKRRRSQSEEKKLNIPGFDGPLITENLFKRLQPDDTPESVIKNAYNDYKTKYENKKFSSFYVEHHSDEWFKERYDPDVYYSMLDLHKNQSIKLSKLFEENMKEYENVNLLYDRNIVFKNVAFYEYTYDSVNPIETENKEGEVNANSPVEDISKLPYFGFEPDKATLFIHQLPRYISKNSINDIAMKVGGFVSISLSEPIKNQNYNRYCWLTFDTEDNCSKAYELLHNFQVCNDYKCNPVKSKSTTFKNIRVTPFLYKERIDEDYEMTTKIIEILNNQCEITPLVFDQNLSKETLLDMNILYLRKVHGFCYYCFEIFEDERNLSTKCDNAHLRYGYIGNRGEEVENKEKIDKYDQELTSKAKEFISKGGIPHLIKKINYEQDEEVKKQREEFFRENIKRINDEKFKCRICTKMFKAENFIHNHILNKHSSMVKEEADKQVREKKKKENYMNDTKKNYEKIKIMDDMNEYLNYLSAMKKHQYENNNNNAGKKNYHRDREYRDRYQGKRHSYRDYDDTEKRNNNYTGRKLISYEDL